MSVEFQQRSYATGERLFLLVTRMLSAALLTALVGAIENWFYERFFAPDLYATGHPLARGAFMLAISFPYILVGLALLGLPAAYALRRVRAESALVYAITGTITGALWGLIVLEHASTYGSVLSALYGCLCALFWWGLRPR